jgi:hypothetical protein
MNGAAKKKWMNFLNKKHRKATGRLYDGENRSAIGLLCLSYQVYTGNGAFLEGGWFEDSMGTRSRSGAPLDVLDWAGLRQEGPGIKFGPGEYDTIVALNDGLGDFPPQPFDVIKTIVAEFL